MTDGKGCKCGAYSYADCGCPDVDWSCGECAKLKAELAEAVRLLGETKAHNCDGYHHQKKDRHGYDEPCPIMQRVEAFLAKHKSTT